MERGYIGITPATQFYRYLYKIKTIHTENILLRTTILLSLKMVCFKISRLFLCRPGTLSQPISANVTFGNINSTHTDDRSTTDEEKPQLSSRSPSPDYAVGIHAWAINSRTR
jgi:hypothetical protein